MTATEKQCHKTHLYLEIKDYQWPIVYSPDYNISLCGLERLQSYDILKARNILLHLKDAGILCDNVIVRPNEAQTADLLVVHSKIYLSNLKWGSSRNGLSDLPSVGLIPSFLVDSKILRPLRYQTGGTILAAKLALDRGWSINLGGGFHHCCANRGGGFCAYADITLAIRFLLDRIPDLNKVMIVDLDASQCNGPERDFLGDERLFIFDMYNRHIYPQDGFAKRGIKRKIELQAGICDDEYLHLLRRNLDEVLYDYTPDFVLYVAGSSVLAGDPVGQFSLTDQRMRTRGIPVAMVTGGGYGKDAARVTAQSILNLYHLGLITAPEAAATSSSATASVSASGSDVGDNEKQSKLSNDLADAADVDFELMSRSEISRSKSMPIIESNEQQTDVSEGSEDDNFGDN